MSYHNLSNEEIVFLYYVSKNVSDQYEQAYKSKQLQQTVPTKDGVMKVETFLPDELLEEILKSEHYLLMKSVKDKLKPIYELIIEVEPEIETAISNIFNTKPD